SGAALGAAQSFAFSRGRPPVAAWIAATALGLMVGLGVGATAVDFDTTFSALVVQGAICGLAVGLGQAFVLFARHRTVALALPPLLTLAWASGWAITTAIGVQVDDQFTVFGSSGALVVTAATSFLPLVLERHGRVS